MATEPKSINTKVTLVVKSGPGVIIGITEKDVIDGEIDFSGIQFDTPGEYVISVIPSSNELQGTEFTINVGPEEDIIPQNDSRGEELNRNVGDRPIISQIDKPSITLDPIEFDITNNKQENNEIGFGLGFTPFFWYNAVQIPERDILSLELYHEGIVPMVSISFIDTLDLMRKEGVPLNDTKFEIFLSSGSENLKSIHLKFKLKNFQENKKKSYTIIGTIDLTDFYNIVYKSYTGTSFEALKKISKELKLGFNSNINDTNDSMKWANTGLVFKDFVSNIIEHSYISDTSFMLGYIDHYWCFNYVDIEKEWTRDISGDVGINSQGMSQVSEKGDSDKILPLVLTNDPSENNTCFYFKSHVVNNNSTHQSLDKGNYTVTKYYDSNSKSFLIFDVDSLTTDKDEVISLKGSPGDKKSFNENYRTNYLGRVDMENIHQNYHYSETQNRINLDELVKITVDIELPQANYNLYKYQKVKINFLNLKRTPGSPSLLNERISGEWLIIDIRYIWKRGSLSQKIKAARKELNKLTEELDIPTESKENNTNNSEINNNPNDNENVAPNSVYNVGELYTVSDKNGKRYQILIDKLSDDGKEVVGQLKEL